MKRPRVFVPQEPTRRDRVSGELQRAFDLSPATEFGDLVFLIPAGQPPLDPGASLPILRDRLADFGAGDFLMAVGPPQLIAWASIYAARASGGIFRLLAWRGDERRYMSIAADLSEQEKPT